MNAHAQQGVGNGMDGQPASPHSLIFETCSSALEGFKIIWGDAGACRVTHTRRYSNFMLGIKQMPSMKFERKD